MPKTKDRVPLWAIQRIKYEAKLKYDSKMILKYDSKYLMTQKLLRIY